MLQNSVNKKIKSEKWIIRNSEYFINKVLQKNYNLTKKIIRFKTLEKEQ